MSDGFMEEKIKFEIQSRNAFVKIVLFNMGIKYFIVLLCITVREH